MAERFEPKRFQNLLRKAIGNRSQAEFANQAGMSATYLSKLLTAQELPRPRIDTLRTIVGAAQGGITLREFMIACDYEDSTVQEAVLKEQSEELVKRKAMPTKKRIRQGILDIKEGIEHMLEERPYACKDIPDFLDTVEMLYSVESYSFDIDTTKDAEDSRFPFAEEASAVTVGFADKDFATEFAFILYFYRTKNNKMFVTGVAFDFPTLLDMRSRLAMEADEQGFEYDPDNYVVLSMTKEKRGKTKEELKQSAANLQERIQGIMKQKNVSEKEAWAIALFGDPDAPKRLHTEEGEGFYVDKVKPRKVVEFLKKHKNTFCRSQKEVKIYEDVLAGVPLDEAFESYSVEHNGNGSDHWACAVSNIIYRETDIRVGFWEDFTKEDEERFKNRPSLMFSQVAPWLYNETEKSLTMDSCRQILDKYAWELGVEIEDKNGVIFYMEMEVY